MVINSKETIESVKFMTGFWKDAHDEGGLAWDDTNNNRAFLSQTISATLNGASIYIELLRNPDKYITEKGAQLKTDILHAAAAQGPGRPVLHAHLLLARAAEVLQEREGGQGLPEVGAFQGRVREVVRLAEGLRHAADRGLGEAQGVGRGPVMLPYKVAGRLGRTPGYAGPANAKSAEVLSKYIITDMYAKAVQGMPAEEAVKWAEGELKKVYV